MTRHMLSILLGAAGAIALVLSCSGNGVSTVDAQTECDCPAAEPPLAGRIVHATATTDITANGNSSTVVNCAVAGGTTVLGGSCNSDVPRAFLRNSGTAGSDSAWGCAWHNDSDQTGTGTVIAICLMPAAE